MKAILAQEKARGMVTRKPANTALSDDQKEAALLLVRAGWTKVRVAEVLGVGEYTVYRIVKQASEPGK